MRLVIPKGDRNENLSSFLPQILIENLFNPEQFFDENNQSILNKEYIDTNVRDGTEWCLGITYTDQSTFSSEGSNEYGTFSLTSYDR